MSVREKIIPLKSELPENVVLVAVSKTHPVEAIIEAYECGQRVFGESRHQEMCAKQAMLPGDIQWHMIGHLQTNKVRSIAGFVSMIHSVDSVRLLELIDKEAARAGRVIDILLEIKVADEESKHGWDEAELVQYLSEGHAQELKNVRFRGVMTIATNTDDMSVVKNEFMQVKALHEKLRKEFFDKDFDTVSMGMTSDYGLAVECGSTMVRVGSLIFGERDYSITK